MSTNSLIGLAAGDGFENAVYCASDGYPTSMGPTLMLLAERRGIAGAWAALDAAKRGGWSIIQPDRVERAEAWESEHGTDYPGGRIPTYLDERGEWVDGVGYQHTDTDDWREDWHGGELRTCAEWAYAIDIPNGTLSVFDLGDAHPVLVGVARFGDLDIEWGTMECGSAYERCSHYASFHFPELDTGSRLGTAQYLGREPLTVQDAIALVDQSGDEWRLTGGGYLERDGRGYTDRWFGTATSGEARRDFHLWSNNGDDTPTPNPALTFIFPPLRADSSRQDSSLR